MDRDKIEEIVKIVLDEVSKRKAQSREAVAGVYGPVHPTPLMEARKDEEVLEDLSSEEVYWEILVPEPADPEAIKALRKSTSARIGVWRAGPRYKTKTLLRFRADHAVAQDTVWREVSEEYLKEVGLFSVQTMVCDKDEYLTRPDLGRILSDDAVRTLQERCVKNPQVQIMVADGLSSAAIEANVKDILPVITQGLQQAGIKMGTPFFIKYGRVGAQVHAGEILGAEATCILIGERPGLGVAESMSAYMVYKPQRGVTQEADGSVISNIYKGGTPPVEAGAYIVKLLQRILEAKVSGVKLARLEQKG